MTRYREEPGQYEMDSRHDEDDGAPCSECGDWTREELLEPCPAGVFPRVGSVCPDCAETLRAEVERQAAE